MHLLLLLAGSGKSRIGTISIGIFERLVFEASDFKLIVRITNFFPRRMAAESSSDIEELRKVFVANLKRRHVRDTSLKLAMDTVNFLRKLVVHEKYDNIEELLYSLGYNGRLIAGAEPSELVIRNVVLMVAKLAREENTRLINGDQEPLSPYDSLNKLWKKNEGAATAAAGKKLRKNLIQAVKEVAIEMETCRESVSGQAIDLISAGDVLIVHSLRHSKTLDSFLMTARKTKKHRILSVQDAEEAECLEFATSLRLCDVAGKMCEATKVILPGAAVLPDGSCLVPAGGLSICLAANKHSVPVYILTAFYKISPFFLPDPTAVNPHTAPQLPFSLARQFAGKVRILQPSFDVIPSSLVTLYVSNTASIMPSHIYRLIGDYYHPEDIVRC